MFKGGVRLQTEMDTNAFIWGGGDSRKKNLPSFHDLVINIKISVVVVLLNDVQTLVSSCPHRWLI